MPLRVVAVPHSPYLVVTSSGFHEQFLAVLDAGTQEVVQRVPVAQGWMGLAVSSDGRRVFASAGAENRVLVYRFSHGRLTEDGDIRLDPHTFPAGLALSSNGRRLYIAGNLSNSAIAVDTGTRKVLFRSPVGSKPYMCVLVERLGRLYVSNWGERSVTVLHAASGKLSQTIALPDRPNDLLSTPDGEVVFAANGDRNTVCAIVSRTGRVAEEIQTSLSAGTPGSTPNALALDWRRRTLYVANADNNAVAVIDISHPARSTVRGFIPTAWYPAGVALTERPEVLVVVNGKGAQSRPNAPLWAGGMGRHTASGTVGVEDRKNPGYIGAILEGTASFVGVPGPQELAAYTAQVRRNFPKSAEVAEPFPLGKDSPIRHVFYIIKENRTYDQILGDMPEGRGDPDYCLFGERTTPNHHALARDFVLIDNLYHNAEVSASGHFWVNSAYDRDYVEKFWPSTYSGRGRERKDYHDDAEAYPSHGFLWDLCARFGVSYRSYGEFARVAGATGDGVRPATATLAGHVHPTYRGADYVAGMGDLTRYEIWLKEFREFERQGRMPRFQVMSLPGDHTLGTRPGRQTPRAMVAENDLALGRIVDAISHSVFWKDTAIFVIEDDPQNGPDHVDCHRTVAYVISPYVKRHYVDHTMYSAVSLLRTMELLLGLPPMSQYDAAATPMWNLFQARPEMQAYAARPAGIPLEEQNTALSYGAKRSLAMDLDEVDDTDEDELTEVVWKSVRGANSPVPPRRVAAFAAIP